MPGEEEPEQEAGTNLVMIFCPMFNIKVEDKKASFSKISSLTSKATLGHKSLVETVDHGVFLLYWFADDSNH
jgi:hypothetical protein